MAGRRGDLDHPPEVALLLALPGVEGHHQPGLQRGRGRLEPFELSDPVREIGRGQGVGSAPPPGFLPDGAPPPRAVRSARRAVRH
jgi:hypothetical protein